MTTNKPLLRVIDARRFFEVPGERWIFARKRVLKANDGISFSLERGRTLGVVGESGCGKSTLARSIIGLEILTSGKIYLHGKELSAESRHQLRRQRNMMQMIFQDPLASLDPRMTVGEIIAEPLKVLGSPDTQSIQWHVHRQMKRVGLLQNQINRYPHEFSGGQCQRIGIARALIAGPDLLLCDEPVSALDVSIQAQIINLLKQIQKESGLAMIFISHDLSVVRHISHDIMVMYLGRVVEKAQTQSLFDQPQHPYSRALIDAIPIPDPVLERRKNKIHLIGELPSPLDNQKGCVFRSRCSKAGSDCADNAPVLKLNKTHHEVACFYPGTD